MSGGFAFTDAEKTEVSALEAVKLEDIDEAKVRAEYAAASKGDDDDSKAAADAAKAMAAAIGVALRWVSKTDGDGEKYARLQPPYKSRRNGAVSGPTTIAPTGGDLGREPLRARIGEVDVSSASIRLSGHVPSPWRRRRRSSNNRFSWSKSEAGTCLAELRLRCAAFVTIVASMASASCVSPAARASSASCWILSRRGRGPVKLALPPHVAGRRVARPLGLAHFGSVADSLVRARFCGSAC